MKRRKWEAAQKFKIVLEGLNNNENIAELCNRHGISQTQYYQWRDRLLSEGEKLFIRGGVDKHEELLKTENRQLKGIIGDLTVELKKNDW